VFGGERIQGLMSLLQIEDLPMENKMLSDSLNDAQRKVESYFFGAPRAARPPRMRGRRPAARPRAL
jgi:preprotein translocase subunit SecA